MVSARALAAKRQRPITSLGRSGHGVIFIGIPPELLRERKSILLCLHSHLFNTGKTLVNRDLGRRAMESPKSYLGDRGTSADDD
jgi:hypothetical protein